MFDILTFNQFESQRIAMPAFAFPVVEQSEWEDISRRTSADLR
jgi:hypothetical protein